MADQEPDGVNEAFQASARVALTAGGMIAERIIRAREQAHRDAEATSQQHARELQARIDSERGAARASLAPVARDDWWDQAGPQEIGVAWETANAWRDVDADAQRTTERMRDELRRRYAIDTDSLGADPTAVQEALERRARALSLAAQARQEARVDEAVAVPLLVAAAAADRAQDEQRQPPTPGAEAAHDGERLYDSAERRRELANDLEGVADEETIDAVVLADTNQAQPPEEAVSHGPKRAPRATRARGKTGRGRSSARRSERGR